MSMFVRRLVAALVSLLVAMGLAAAIPGSAVAATLTLAPVADATVRSDIPGENNGTLPILRERASGPSKITYVRFNVTGIPAGEVVTSATLRLRSLNAVAGTLSAGATGTSWVESGTGGITWATRPAIGSVLDTSPTVTGGWTDLDVTAAVTANDLVSFGVVTTALADQEFASLQNSTVANRPQLVVVTAVPPDTQAPSVPTGLVGTGNHTPPSVDLAWSASTDNVGVAGYSVLRDGAVVAATVAGTSWQDTALTNGETHSYAVEAYDAAGNRSPASVPASVTVPQPPDTTAPTVPANLAGTPNAPQDPPQVALSWSAATDNIGVTGYTVRRDGVALPDVTGTMLTDAAVAAGQTYAYTVDSFDAAGNRSAASAPVSVTVPNPPPPVIALGHWRNRPSESGTTWRSRMDAAETQFGAFAGHWRDYEGPGTSGQLSTVQEQALADGKRLFINWKPWASGGTWASVANGSRDSVIIAAAQDWANACDDNGECWIAIGHEPENDLGSALGTAADHKAMFQRASGLFALHAPEVKVAWVMMGFEQHQPSYPALWPGAEYVDLIGHDTYVACGGDPALLADRFISRSAWFRANMPGASGTPVVLAEWGADLGGVLSPCSSGGDIGTPQHRADSIAGVTARLDEIAAAGVVELDFFDARSDAFSCADVSCVDAQAYVTLKTATEG